MSDHRGRLPLLGSLEVALPIFCGMAAIGYGFYSFGSSPARTAAMMLVAIGHWLLAASLWQIWSHGAATFEFDDVGLTKTLGGRTWRVLYSDEASLSFRGPFGETYPSEAGRLSLLWIRCGNQRISISPHLNGAEYAFLMDMYSERTRWRLHEKV
jgi:hypothetical protein